jgi:hypothetical protein
MCENVGTETTCATIEFLRKRGRIIVAAQASFVNHYFVLVAENLFLHSLNPQETLLTLDA